MSVLCLRNSQKSRKINLRLLRRIALFTLKEVFHESRFELGIRLVGADEMAKVNETFLQHSGSTDVVTFDYAEEKTTANASSAMKPAPSTMHGEIFVSIDDAVAQAIQFRTTWQSELARYVVHGILHLRGFDDLNPVARRKMKREENRVLKILELQFPLAQLRRKPGAKNG